MDNNETKSELMELSEGEIQLVSEYDVTMRELMGQPEEKIQPMVESGRTLRELLELPADIKPMSEHGSTLRELLELPEDSEPMSEHRSTLRELLELPEDDINHVYRRNSGGFRALPFIFANEICDIFASRGVHANMMMYLTEQLNMPIVEANKTLNIFSGTSNLTLLLGAFVADSFAGKFWTIFVASIIYELGLISILTSAMFPSLRPSPCPSQHNCQEASKAQLSVIYTYLILTALGASGIRPCVTTFAADQVDMRARSVANRKWNFFNWYSFASNVASLTAFIIIVYIQENISWVWGFGVPTIAWGISIIVFACGSPLYNKVKVRGSPLKRLLQVIVAAFKKRKLKVPDDASLLYHNRELDATISVAGQLLHSDQFRWVDKAAIITEEERGNLENPNLWRLNTVHRVEELKAILRLLPIWAPGIISAAASTGIPHLLIKQAQSMDRHLTHSFAIPSATLAIFSIITTMFGIVLYERCFVPIARRFSGNPAGINCLQRMGIGSFINIIATIVLAIIETKRRKVAASHNLLDDPNATIPISVFWLVPQYIVHGVGEIFLGVGNTQFMYEQSPESMRSTAVALSSVATGIGNYLGALLASLLHRYSDWQSNNINTGHLHYYLYLVAAIQGLSLVCFLICARHYTNKQEG